MANSARLKISLSEVESSPWRLVDVPLSMTLTGLHRTIQAVFLWHDCHLWDFVIDGKRYGPHSGEDDADELFNADVKRLNFLTSKIGEDFYYVYDMGDYWTHRIEVVGALAAPAGTRLPEFIDGAGRTPPENIGGPPGFAHFLECIRDKRHPEHAGMVEWYGKEFHPDDIEEDILKIALRRESSMRQPVK